jgi:5-methylcytosine-specific restriction endonuclease McrA
MRDIAAKQEYDRQRARRIYEDFVARRLQLIESFGGACQNCSVALVRDEAQFHHVVYDEVESNYPRTCKTMSVRLKRLAEAEQHPERFKLLCVTCHNLEHERDTNAYFN